MNKKFYFLFAFILIILISNSVNSEVQELPPVKLGTCADIVQLCANCTFVNVSVLQQPNKDKIVLNLQLQNLGQGYFNFTFCNNTIKGEVIVNGIGDPDGVNTPWNYNYKVNLLGKTLSNSQAILYFLVFTVSFIFFILLLVTAFSLPSKNIRQEFTGYLLAVENLKYLRMLLFAFSYLFVMLMSYFGWIISLAFLDLDFLGNLFRVVFYILVVLIIPLFIVSFVIIVANIIRDAKLNEHLARGLLTK